MSPIQKSALQPLVTSKGACFGLAAPLAYPRLTDGEARTAATHDKMIEINL